jgi:hypothetical protein
MPPAAHAVKMKELAPSGSFDPPWSAIGQLKQALRASST